MVLLLASVIGLGIVIGGCAPKAPKDVSLIKESVQVKMDKFPRLAGQLKNQSGKDLQVRSIAVTVWENEKRNYVKDAGITWLAQNLKANETINFEVQFPDSKSKEDLAIYSYEIRWFDKRANRVYALRGDS